MIQFRETSLYGPVMSGALGVNLRNCELCKRLHIIAGGSYILCDVQMVRSCFHLLSYFVLSYITVLC